MRKSRLNFESRTISSSSGIDYKMLGAVILLTLMGVIMVYDASVVQSLKDYGDKYAYIKQQLVWMVLGYIAMILLSFFDHRYFRKFALGFFIFSFILLLAVFLPGLGVSAGGAHRWLRIGGFTLQPAEIIKLSSVIFLATLFEKRKAVFPFFSVLLSVSLVMGIFQKDMGSAIVYFFMCIFLFLIANGPMTYFLMSLLMALVGFVVLSATSAYRRQRILAFLDPFSDPQGYSYHISQVLIAIGSGGWFGLGLGQSRQKFEYIPEVTTDSIFAIVGEEFGFLGSLLLIGAFAFLIYRGFKLAESLPDGYSKYLAFGLTCWLGIQVAVNLAAMVSLIPLTGVPLPFISYGGSALLANLAAIGILLNISKKRV